MNLRCCGTSPHNRETPKPAWSY